MSWTQILSHERVKKILQRAIFENKIASAYLFWGLEGIGKEALALEFAKTVNCLEPNIEQDVVSACDKCRSCKQAKAMTHPNIQIVFSLPAGKGTDNNTESPLAKLSEEQLTEISEQIKYKSEDIYHKISIPNANQIKIASIREVKKNLTMSANSKGRRFAIIFNAEEMTSEASNAFLKTLEEPHQNITIILISSKKEMLLQTILSRCQQIHCEPIPDEVLAKFLAEKYDKPMHEAKLIATFAQGSVLRSIDFLDDDMQALRTDIVDTLRASLKKNYRMDLSGYLDKMLASKNKNKIEYSLKMLLIWMRDYFIYTKTGSTDTIVNQDQADRIVKFADLFPNADVSKVLDEIEQAIYKLRRNVNQQLILITLFLKIRQWLLRTEL